MAVLKFKKADLQKIIDHTLQHPEMTPSFKEMSNRAFWKADAKPNTFGWVRPEDVDVSKIQPYVSLVKDAGIYIMSGSKNVLSGSNQGTLHHVVYAEGYGQKADYDAIREAAGGDDFSESLPLDFLLQGMELPGNFLKIKLNRNSVRIIP
jgi:hypothetical protein